MTEQELKGKLAQALDHAAPDDVEALLSRCETRKGTVIPMTTKKKNGAFRALIAACLALVLVGGGGGVFYQQAYAVASVVSLDVNPSIALKVNRNERVIACDPLNEDAALVLADMGGGADLKGTKLDVAVNAIVGALLQKGYLDSISSAILISVEDRDEERAARLRQELTAAVDGVLQTNFSNAAVLSQTLTMDAELEEQAQRNSISTGKAALVSQVQALNGALEFEKLAALSVEELKDLKEIGAPAMPIGQAAARYAAEQYAGTLAVDSVTTEVDPELDETRPHYEVELRHPTLGEFEYIVDAWTGEVLSGQANLIQSMDSGLLITGAQALNIALEHSAQKNPTLTSYNSFDHKVKMDTEDGTARYDVEFIWGGYEFEYVIDASSGTVLHWKSRQNGQNVSAGGGLTPDNTVPNLTEEAAKAVALGDAGVREDQITGLKVKLDKEDGRAVYEVEFRSGTARYEYEIDAVDGTVWKKETEPAETSASGAADTADIGKDAAKAVALTHAGLTEEQVSKLKVERDSEDGRLEYEVEFKAGGMEYEYTIDGASGAILARSMDRD